jgi:hypothetical protein
MNRTRIEDLASKNKIHSFVEVDERRYCVTMLDSLTRSTLAQDVCCFWCRHAFATQALGCPIGYAVGHTSTEPRFETDGVFCSFNCCLAFIQDRREEMYSDSAFLLKQLYAALHPEDAGTATITPAPHWRLLRAYGGALTLDEFRAAFNMYTFRPVGTVTRNVDITPVGALFEEIFIF